MQVARISAEASNYRLEILKKKIKVLEKAENREIPCYAEHKEELSSSLIIEINDSGIQ